MTAATVFYLLEDVDPALDCRGLRLVSLNPAVSYFLTQKSIPYQIPEDFYDEHALRQGEEEYFLEQLDWFRRFDSFLKKEIHYCGRNQISLARAHYLILKYFVDSVIIQAKILRSIVQKIASSGGSIVYVRGKSKSRKIKTVHTFRKHEREPLWGEMLPDVCKSYGVRYEFRNAEDTAGPVSAMDTRPQSHFSLAGFKSFAKEARRFFYQQYSSLTNLKIEKPLSIFFVHTGSEHLDPLVQNLIRAGHRVYTFMEGKAVGLNEFMPALPPCLAEESGQELQELDDDCHHAANQFQTEAQEILSWVSQKCGSDVSALVLPYFQDFIAGKCFSILKRVREMLEFYRQNRIDFVVSHTSSDTDSQCALIAARLAPGIKTIGIQHGSDVFNDRAWHVHDLDAFDYYFASDGLSEEKFCRASQLDYIESAQIFQSPHYFKKAQSRNLKPRDISNRKVKNVLYIPTRLSGHVRYFNCLVYPTLWFFEYQKRLIEYFIKQKHLKIFYKHAMTFDRFGSDSIIPFIKNKQPSNIRVIAGRVVESLDGMDAVIMDRPTTAFFEVVACGLPVLALYPDFIQALMDAKASQYFGKSLQSFSDADEATRKIDLFLKSGLSEYRQTLPLQDLSFAGTLREIQQSLRTKPKELIDV